MCVSPAIFLRIRCVCSVVFFFLLGSVRRGARGLLCRIIYKWRRASALRATFGDDEFGTNAETFAESFLGGVGVMATFGNGGILFGFGIFLLIGAGVTAANPLLVLRAGELLLLLLLEEVFQVLPFGRSFGCSSSSCHGAAARATSDVTSSHFTRNALLAHSGFFQRQLVRPWHLRRTSGAGSKFSTALKLSTTSLIFRSYLSKRRKTLSGQLQA